MITITDLAETLCGAMGLHPDLGAMSIEYLTDHDMLEGGDAKAEPSHAAGLLIALAGSGEMYAPHKTVERYWDLPLIEPLISQFWDRVVALEPMPDDDPIASHVRAQDGRFGDVLTSLISGYAFGEAVSIVPRIMTIGYGPGLTRADIHLFPAAPGEIRNGFILNFSTGETTLPDDAPRARLERTATVPGEIFDVLRETLAGKSAPPAVLEHPYFDPDSLGHTQVGEA